MRIRKPLALSVFHSVNFERENRENRKPILCQRKYPSVSVACVQTFHLFFGSRGRDDAKEIGDVYTKDRGCVTLVLFRFLAV